MLKDRVISFLNKELVDFTNFRYEIEDEGEFVYVIFTEVLGEVSQIETTFKLFDKDLYFHSTSYGWKNLEKTSMNKFLWIELLTNQ